MPLFDDEDELQPKRRNNLDDGTDRRKKKTDKEAEATKKMKKAAKFALRPERMFFKDEERKMYAEYFNRFKEDIEERYDEFTTAQEILVDCLCYAIVRMERKSRLESFFGRFFDRVAPHDPLGQINSTLKSLGLLPEKKESKEASATQEIRKILAADADAASENNQKEQNYAEWVANFENKNIPTVESRTPSEIPVYMDNDLILPEEDDEDAT